MCCIEAEVIGQNFYKPANTICPHMKNGCAIYGSEERPACCNSYQCCWLRGFGLEEDRPDKTGIIISIGSFNNGIWIFARERIENAIYTTGKNILLDVASKINLPVIIVDFKSKPPLDTGDYTIIKKSLEHRSKAMMGKLICYLDNCNEYPLYELAVD